MLREAHNDHPVSLQIHLLQFHGTKYSAIDPAMVSAEELEVQKGNLSITQEEQ